MNEIEMNRILDQTLRKLILRSTTSITPAVVDLLTQYLQKNQNNPIISAQLQLMLDNEVYGRQTCRPVCQDTGIVNFFIQHGRKFPFFLNFQEIIQQVLRDLTLNAVLRPNSVDPISGTNPGTNLGENVPPIYYELKSDLEDVIITVLNKGGGSENFSALFMLPSTTELEEIPNKICGLLQNAAGKPCPPVIIGIGLGGDALRAMFLARKALLRPVGIRHKRSEIAQLEEQIITAVNSLDIGIMGLGGHPTCMDVHVEWAMRHPASFPLGVIVECYSHRIQSCRISSSGDVEFGELDRNYDFVKRGEQ
jgi:fumarate hydratase subunit alpha